MTVFTHAESALLAATVMHVVGRGIFLWLNKYYIQKLLRNVPRMTWLTFEQVVEKTGCSRLFAPRILRACIVLNMCKTRGCSAVRDENPRALEYLSQVVGGDFRNIRLLEFRFGGRTHWRKDAPAEQKSAEFDPALTPVFT